jgi:hypothetical protein
VASYSWADLGVDGDLRDVVDGRTFVFAAKQGSTDFQRVDDAAAGALSQAVVRADDDGFDLVGTTSKTKGEPALVVLRSNDGRTWSPGDASPGNVTWARAAGRVDGRIVIVGGDNDGDAVLVDNASGGWTSARLSDVVGGLPAGTTLGVLDAAVGPAGAVIVASEDPTFVQPAAERDAAPGAAPPSVYHLLVSRDGITWSDTLVSDVAGGNFTPSQLYLAGDQAVVSLYGKVAGATKATHVNLVASLG